MDRQQNVRMLAGDDRLLNIGVTNPTGADLTNATARYIVARSAYDPRPPLISKTTGSGITVNPSLTPPYAIILQVTLANDDTAELPAGWYYHEAMLILQTGVNIAVMQGEFRLDPSHIASQL